MSRFLNFLTRNRITLFFALQGIIIILGVLAVSLPGKTSNTNKAAPSKVESAPVVVQQVSPNEALFRRNTERQQAALKEFKESEPPVTVVAELPIKPERFTVADYYSIDSPTGYLNIQVIKDTKTSEEYLLFHNSQSNSIAVILAPLRTSKGNP